MSIFLYSHLFLNCLQNSSRPRRTIGEIVNEARTLGSGQVDAVSGVEIDLADFTDIRFGQDRRLDEVARMLCSSKVPSVKGVERPELKSSTPLLSNRAIVLMAFRLTVNMIKQRSTKIKWSELRNALLHCPLVVQCSRLAPFPP